MLVGARNGDGVVRRGVLTAGGMRMTMAVTVKGILPVRRGGDGSALRRYAWVRVCHGWSVSLPIAKCYVISFHMMQEPRGGFFQLAAATESLGRRGGDRLRGDRYLGTAKVVLANSAGRSRTQRQSDLEYWN